MTRRIAYRRVSTETQLDGYGLDIQSTAIDHTVAELGPEPLAATYTDEGICGAEGLDVRHALAAALNDLEDHPGTVLIVPKLDRLARDLMVQESILADCWRTGAEVVSCSPSESVYLRRDDPDDPARKLIRQVLGAVSEYERALIRLRLRRGKRRRLDQDGYAGGPVPYGFADPGERANLDAVADLRRHGYTWVQVARQLNVSGRRKRNGQPWTASEIHRAHTRHVQRVGTLRQGALL